MEKFYVFDEGSDLYSCYYDSFEDAKIDLDNDISYKWSSEAIIVKCEVN